MQSELGRIGLLGGTGMLGSAIATGLIESGFAAPGDLAICSRSGRAEALACYPGLRIMTETARFCDSCDTVLLCLPPAATAGLRLPLENRLVLSVMAGVTLDGLSRISGSARLVRAMSSPAAARRLAYTPWVASPGTTEADRRGTAQLFSAIGATDRLEDEGLLDHFTAMTGPVPGFVAFFADAMIRHAEAQGVPPQVADRAIRQLFFAAGQMMAEDATPPGGHVTQMIDYAGTTAAGLQAMQDGPIREAVSEGLAAAAARARGIA
ncbi:pyrroline-5-carboxylate reductase family protein [Salipiger mucosus]|uniref:Pyrroline-5-carboxylate reductase n=1 Tax=Salipiger mucosus DSM 16094 TaxID=1123237 RepID=S9QBQ5_9RHOB|nr:pyrroline-5-carboxylate reductase dimerization domain-containing protein [Salipiger mucosus]EPX78846.1 Pyrroline-5-carboxylate reductase [Salipiger mucosus DSM 16094]